MKWLILRGLVREQKHWGNFPVEFERGLKEKDPEAKVYCLDAPGFGTEHARPSPTSISGIVDDFRSRWQRLRSPNDEWCLLAISLGGMIAMDWTSRYPQDFKKAVLINSSVGGLSPIHHRMRPVNYPVIASLFAIRDLAKREEKILSLTTNLTSDQIKEKARIQAQFAKPIRKKDAAAQIFAATRFRPPARIEIPVLVLAAKGDQLVNYSCSEQIAKHFGAQIIYHDTANHDLSTDDPEWISAQVRNWVFA